MARKSAGVMMVTDAPVSKRTSIEGVVLKEGRKFFRVLAVRRSLMKARRPEQVVIVVSTWYICPVIEFI